MPLVIAERGPDGIRLVAIDERGDRQFELITPPAAVARDTNPAVSPDGRWIAFASSRGRSLDETSLWIAPLAPHAIAHAIAAGAWIDAHPTWTPDGAAIVYASTRAHGNFDLFRIAIAGGDAVGDPVALTDAPSHEVTPSVAPDGSIFFARVTPSADGTVESHLEVRAPSGELHAITAGPADSSPAISPDGRELAFVRPVIHRGAPDAELALATPDGQHVRTIVELPPTDEGGPVWSRDGAVVLATSVVRDRDARVVFSSVIAVDLREHPRVARVLVDRVGPIERLTPSATAEPIDRHALDRDPPYLPELARYLAARIDRAADAPTPEDAPAP